MVLIYRVEQDDGDGPYFYSRGKSITFNITHDKWLPEPGNDGIDCFDWENKDKNINLRCAFKDFDQLKRWFCPTSREQLKRHYKFKVYEYKIHKNSVKYGGTQVMFPYDQTKRTGKIYDLETLNPL